MFGPTSVSYGCKGDISKFDEGHILVSERFLWNVYIIAQAENTVGD